MNETELAKRWVNLASDKLGGVAAQCSDDFFAPMRRMLRDTPPVFIDGKYDDNGKWMDGWESRRKRIPGHDWCIVQLACAGVIHGVIIDTSHFTGNYPPGASLEACISTAPDESTEWHELIAQCELGGDRVHVFAVDDARAFTHVRLNIHPDGGVARLRVYGAPQIDWQQRAADECINFAAALNGAVALTCNDEHFGSIRNLLAPGDGVNMGDGWETRRRRTPGHDWAIIALAHAGVIRRAEISTAHFKGNYPDRCSLQGACLADAQANAVDQLASVSEQWKMLLPEVKLRADHAHRFDAEIIDLGAITHVRLNIHPDGGVSRLRLFGTLS